MKRGLVASQSAVEDFKSQLFVACAERDTANNAHQSLMDRVKSLKDKASQGSAPSTARKTPKESERSNPVPSEVEASSKSIAKRHSVHDIKDDDSDDPPLAMSMKEETPGSANSYLPIRKESSRRQSKRISSLPSHNYTVLARGSQLDAIAHRERSCRGGSR